jgi:hypothetical protein
LSRSQEGDLLTFENHYGYTQDAVNPVIPGAKLTFNYAVCSTGRKGVPMETRTGWVITVAPSGVA